MTLYEQLRQQLVPGASDPELAELCRELRARDVRTVSWYLTRGVPSGPPVVVFVHAHPRETDFHPLIDRLHRYVLANIAPQLALPSVPWGQRIVLDGMQETWRPMGAHVHLLAATPAELYAEVTTA